MSVQAAKDFCKKISDDKSLASSLESAADDDSRRKIAAGAGFDFTRDDMREALSEGSSKQLSDDDLDTIAGGSTSAWVDGGIGVGVGVGASAAAAV